MRHIPVEIMQHILWFLRFTPSALFACAYVCRRWRSMLWSAPAWKRLIWPRIAGNRSDYAPIVSNVAPVRFYARKNPEWFEITALQIYRGPKFVMDLATGRVLTFRMSFMLAQRSGRPSCPQIMTAPTPILRWLTFVLGMKTQCTCFSLTNPFHELFQFQYGILYEGLFIVHGEHSLSLVDMPTCRALKL